MSNIPSTLALMNGNTIDAAVVAIVASTPANHGATLPLAGRRHSGGGQCLAQGRFSTCY